jgi:hypothetical protein
VSVFKNRVLRNVFGSKWDEVTGYWKRLHGEGLQSNICIEEDNL